MRVQRGSSGVTNLSRGRVSAGALSHGDGAWCLLRATAAIRTAATGTTALGGTRQRPSGLLARVPACQAAEEAANRSEQATTTRLQGGDLLVARGERHFACELAVVVGCLAAALKFEDGAAHFRGLFV